MGIRCLAWLLVLWVLLIDSVPLMQSPLFDRRASASQSRVVPDSSRPVNPAPLAAAAQPNRGVSIDYQIPSARPQYWGNAQSPKCAP